MSKAEQEALYAELLEINQQLEENPNDLVLLTRQEFIIPFVDRRRGYTFECEGCESLKGSTLDNGWWRCNACGFPSK